MDRLVFALCLLIAACSHEHGHGHGHEQGHDHAHSHDEALTHSHGAAHAHGENHDHSASQGSSNTHSHAISEVPQPFPVGTWTGTLEVARDTLRLTLADAAGVAVKPEGEAKVVLSGTGLDEQRLRLSAAGGGWAGPAKLPAGKGYTAVVSVSVGGSTESGKVSWGGAHEARPAGTAHD